MALLIRIRPRRLNATIGMLFVIGAALFALGTIPQYVEAVGTVADACTYFLGSIFFTSASFCQLLQAQTPSMAPGRGELEAQRLAFWAPNSTDRGWLAAAIQFPGTLAFNVSTGFAISTSLSTEQVARLVWRPDFVGSILFLVSSVFGILAVSRFFAFRPKDPWWVIAWLNMVGSGFFMLSALGAVILPATGTEFDIRWVNAGTFLGALCFLAGAAALLPAWERTVSRAAA